MVVEFLTFDVDRSERAHWLAHEERHWSRFLERQDGFVRKQIWLDVDDESKVHAVIWWDSLEQWKAIPQEQLDAVVEAMGVLEREATCRTFDVIRER